jgi:hypothetical protein
VPKIPTHAIFCRFKEFSEQITIVGKVVMKSLANIKPLVYVLMLAGLGLWGWLAQAGLSNNISNWVMAGLMFLVSFAFGCGVVFLEASKYWQIEKLINKAAAGAAEHRFTLPVQAAPGE